MDMGLNEILYSNEFGRAASSLLVRRVEADGMAHPKAQSVAICKSVPGSKRMATTRTSEGGLYKGGI